MMSFVASAQLTPGLMQQYFSTSGFASNDKLQFKAGIKKFYSVLNYKTAWIQNFNTGDKIKFADALQSAAGKGLRQNDYSIYISDVISGSGRQMQTVEDSLLAELNITNAAIHFYSDLVYGNTKPALSYTGLNYTPDCIDIPVLLAASILKNKLQLLLSQLSPALPEIIALQNKIIRFQSVITNPGFKEITILPGKQVTANPALLQKLMQLGIITVTEKKWPDSMLTLFIKEAQLQFNLPADGLLGPLLLLQLNVPLTIRLHQLNLSLNYYRWLGCMMKNQSVIVVNLPSALLKVYENEKPVLDMRVIVGKKESPTPTLSATINEVILYPYWHVPYSIATKELLPAIKRNAGFIDAGGYQVLNKNGKILNPWLVNWHAYSTRNFPFIIRQSTGCDNALGLLKLNFINPFSVYLHDTPKKKLFSKQFRYFSHGCMRMEKPMDLGHLVLKQNNIAIDTLTQKGCIKNQSPITVPANNRMPLIVWYNPAGIDALGRIIYYEDVYAKFNWLK